MAATLWFLFAAGFVVLTAVLANFIQILLFIFIKPLSRKFYRRLSSRFTQGPWINAVATVMPKTPMILSGDLPVHDGRPKIIIANHQVDTDWWYIWQVARLGGGEEYVKVILKDALKKVPIFGWGMQLWDFLFLKRKWEQDRTTIKKLMQSFKEDSYAPWIVIFPEGTTVHTEAIEKSNVFAKRQGRLPLSTLVLPRVRGLQALLETNAASCPEVYDMTIAFSGYSGEVPTYAMGYERERDTEIPTVAKLLRGKGPQACFIHIDKFSFEEVRGDIEQWLDWRWQEKEKMMQYFAKHQVFPSSALRRPSQGSSEKSGQQEGEARKVKVVIPKGGFWHTIQLCLWWMLLLALCPAFILLFVPCYTLACMLAVVQRISRRRNLFRSYGWWTYLKGVLWGDSIVTPLEKAKLVA